MLKQVKSHVNRELKHLVGGASNYDDALEIIEGQVKALKYEIHIGPDVTSRGAKYVEDIKKDYVDNVVDYLKSQKKFADDVFENEDDLRKSIQVIADKITLEEFRLGSSTAL